MRDHNSDAASSEFSAAPVMIAGEKFPQDTRSGLYEVL